MLHKAWNSKGKMPYCFPRSSIKFQGHTVQNITDFDPNLAFPDYRPVAAFKSLRFALLLVFVQWRFSPPGRQFHSQNLFENSVTVNYRYLVDINLYEHFDNRYRFLAATKQLNEWFSPSVCLSVCLSVRPSVRHTLLTIFPSSYHHEIFRSYYQWQKWRPCKRSRSEVKG